MRWAVTGGNEIRKTFIDYFQSNGHTHVPSSPLDKLRIN